MADVNNQVDLDGDESQEAPSRYNIYFSYTVEDETNNDALITTRKKFQNLLKADMKSKVVELIDSTPDDVEDYDLEVTLCIADQLDSALGSMM